MTTLATAVSTTCRACEAVPPVTTQRDTYAYSLGAVSGCEFHRALWMAADEREHARGSCPWAGTTCRSGRCDERRVA